MNVLIDSFLDYLRYERNYSEYTINAYFKDLQQFEDFVKEKKEGIFVPEEVDTDIVRNWIISLLDNKISPVSVNRKLSSLKSFFKFLMKQGFVSVNPLRFVTGPKTKKPLPTFVKEKDMEELLDGDGFDEDFEGVRDRLVLEMLYDTGVRRSELVGLQDTDIDYDESLILARYYGIPFYVLGPTSTIDLNCPDGDSIVIEERNPKEITDMWYASRMAPEGVKAYNPAFDVTPHDLITAIITEKGIAYPPFRLEDF